MSEAVVFEKLPVNLAELKAMPQASLTNPNEVAALAIAALAVFPTDKNAAIEMLNFLKGPQPLSNYDISFITDRFRDKAYIMKSYFEGSSPENNYTPTQPYTVVVSENPYSRAQFSEGYLVLYVKSSGADSPRPIKLRTKPSTGQWFLWDQQLLAGIRIPVEEDAWA